MIEVFGGGGQLGGHVTDHSPGAIWLETARHGMRAPAAARAHIVRGVRPWRSDRDLVVSADFARLD